MYYHQNILHYILLLTSPLYHRNLCLLFQQESMAWQSYTHCIHAVESSLAQHAMFWFVAVFRLCFCYVIRNLCKPGEFVQAWRHATRCSRQTLSYVTTASVLLWNFIGWIRYQCRLWSLSSFRTVDGNRLVWLLLVKMGWTSQFLHLIISLLQHFLYII